MENRSYFISTKMMVDPSRVRCSQCQTLADKKDWGDRNWYVMRVNHSTQMDMNCVSYNNLCPDCVSEILNAVILNNGSKTKGE